MDILKYLDVLIGLAVVMILLSPLVSAITQFWVWLSNMRAGRLQVALQGLILQLNGNPYERFEAVAISGLAPGAAVALDGVTATANAAGAITFQNNIPQLLKAGGGTLTFTPPLVGAAVMTFLARGPVGDWEIRSPNTDANGIATVTYTFPGPAQFASGRAVTALPAGTSLSAKIVSGALNGTPLVVTAGPPTTIAYPPNARPVPASHDLEITLTDAAGPVADQQITLRFERNTSFDQLAPLPPPGSLDDAHAKQIARAVLLHPMIAQPSFMKWLRIERSRRGEVVEREELIRILLEFGAGEGSGGTQLTGVRKALGQVLADNGVTDPGRALTGIRDAALHLEQSKPSAAAHERLTAAILAATPSAFVGKINNWFDQAMHRATAEYKFRAQIITIIGAAIVALAVQMDSLDLLKRLATDDKLRNSLVEQGKEQQRRMDDLIAKATPKDQNKDQNKDLTQDEIQLAKVRREEIETNLTKLRDPAMAILPDHFIWQPLPQARLVRNSAWVRPSKRLELVVGASTYAIEPRWTDDPLEDIRNAIASSGAPVDPRIERAHEVVIKTANIENIQVKVDGSDRLIRDDGFAQARLTDKTPRENDQLYLIAGYDPPVPIKAGKNGELKTAIEKSKAGVSVDDTGRIFTATKHETRWIELLTKANDPGTNILSKPTIFVKNTGRLEKASLRHAKQCALSVKGTEYPVDCDVTKIVYELRSRGVDAETRDHLVLTSRRNSPLQLRSVPGRPETNMFTGALETSCSGVICFDWGMLQKSWLGLLVTWMLLSLGAPFWYDLLKDTLKLRSTLASKEEAARNDRQKDTSKPATK